MIGVAKDVLVRQSRGTLRSTHTSKEMIMLKRCVVCHVAALSMLTPLAVGQVVDGMDVSDKLRGDLADVLRMAEGNDLIPVTIIMSEQVPREDIRGAVWFEHKADRRAYVTSLLKDMAANTQGDLLNMLDGSTGVDRVNPMWIHNLVGARVSPELAYQIAARSDVAYLNYDRPMAFEEIFPALDEQPYEGGGPTAAIECGVQLMRAPEVWNDYGIFGTGVVVGVIDTGLCLTHSDIRNHVWTNRGEIAGNGLDDDNNGYVDDVNGWNWENNNNNVSDFNSHGSHVSGTVAGDGTGGEQTGMAPDAQIQVLKFWNSFSGEQTVWDGMQYGMDNGAHVLTASLGWPHSLAPDRVTWRTISENAMHAGVVVMFAAHNYGCFNPPDDVTTPGDVPDMITVGATDCSDRKASFSSCGPSTWETIAPYFDWPNPPGKTKPTISAPGVDTLSHNLCSGYKLLSGTSMATPHVAGTVALMLDANPNLDHWDIKQILKDTALDLGGPGPDNNLGYGRVDAYEAVTEALAHGSGNRLTLTVSGSCPGNMTGTVTGANPGDQIAFVYGQGIGHTDVGICPGVHLDLDQAALLGVANANANGEVSITRFAPASACGNVRVQVLNVNTCEKSLSRGL